MEELLNECTTTQEKKAAERVDAFMRGFIVSERRSRARLKLNYLLAGASSNRFEEAVHLLLERYGRIDTFLKIKQYSIMDVLLSDEVDEDLIQHIDSLIRKELLRSLGPAAEAKEEEQLEGVGKTSIEILRMVRRRLQVEGAVDGGSQTDVKLLAHLVSINDPLVSNPFICKLEAINSILIMILRLSL